MKTKTTKLGRLALVSAAAAAASIGLFGASGAGALGGELTQTSAVRAATGRSVTFAARVTDSPGDQYCTQLTAKIFTNSGAQIGNEISYGTVCNNPVHFYNAKISTAQSTTIGRIDIIARRGYGGPVTQTVPLWF
jgi:hypothetical protein